MKCQHYLNELDNRFEEQEGLCHLCSLKIKLELEKIYRNDGNEVSK